MGINKVQINKDNEIKVLIDLTLDTVTEDTLLEGITAHRADGEQIVGTFTSKLQNKTVTPDTSVQNIVADSRYDGLREVTVNAIPSEYIQPSGTKTITTNGTYDVKSYASATVNVADSGGGNIETCTLTLKSTDTFSNIMNLAFCYINETDNIIENKHPQNYEPFRKAIEEFLVPKNTLIVFRNRSNSLSIDGQCSLVAVTANHVDFYNITGDTIMTYNPCFVKDTKILLADGTTKLVQDITYADNLLVWDFDNGCYISAKPLWIKKAQTADYYYRCEFENGTILKLVGTNGKCHRIFNTDDNIFESATECVGKNIMTNTGISKLISCERIDKTVEFYNIITDTHMNLYAEGVLTSCRLNNIYPIVDMKFVKDNRKMVSRNKYPTIDDNMFRGLRLAEQSMDIEEVTLYVNRLYMLMNLSDDFTINVE